MRMACFSEFSNYLLIPFTLRKQCFETKLLKNKRQLKSKYIQCLTACQNRIIFGSRLLSHGNAARVMRRFFLIYEKVRYGAARRHFTSASLTNQRDGVSTNERAVIYCTTTTETFLQFGAF